MKCFHCGEPVPADTDWQVTIDGSVQPMCCIGCRSIAQAIVDADATAYYRQRTSQAIDTATLESLAPWAALLDDPEWSSAHVETRQDHSAQATLAIEGLRCGACAWLIERILANTSGVQTARANASNARIFLRWNPEQISLSAIAKKIGAIGYALLPIGSAPLEASRRQAERVALRRLFVAGLSSAQVMMYAYPEYLEGLALDADVRSLMRTASMLITVPVMVYSATPFFDAATRALKQRRLNMDVPVSLGLIIAFVASMWAWITNTGEVYFDSVSMFVFLLLGTRWIESRIRAKTSAQRERLATALPTLAQRLAPAPGMVAAWSLLPGDFIRVNSGDRVPADGRLCSAATDVDASWLTGESLPVPVTQGQRMTEGTINLGPAVEIEIQTTVAQGTLSRLSQLAEQAAADRPDWVAWADQIAAKFTAGILLLTGALVGGSMLMEIPSSQWIASVIAVLVVTCPCALSMAGPAAYAAALAALLEKGVAVTSAQTLERLRSVTDIVFDKTGTLTDPASSQVTMAFGEPDAWRLALAISQDSTHPLAHAIARQARTVLLDGGLDPAVPTPAQLTQHAGLGIEGQWEGQCLRLGSLSFTDPTDPTDPTGDPNVSQRSLAQQHAACTVFLALGKDLIAGFQIDDEIRPEAEAVLNGLRRQGITVWCLSGDRADRVSTLTQRLGLPQHQALAAQTPEMKRNFVAQLQSAGKVVAMVGDGHNDAPVLAQADVSFAMQGAAPLARQKADIYLLRSGLDGVHLTLSGARRARNVLNQNLSWALMYNVLAIPFAVVGMISPLGASVGMACSSLLVVLNSARLLR
jgi:Cu2+-exporting ATPase